VKKTVEVLALILFMLSPLAKAADEEIDAVIKNIQQKIESLDSYQADMEMVFLKSSQGVTKVEGHIEFVKPDKLSMIMGVKDEENTRQYMYSDGMTIWQYMPMFKVVSKVDLAALKKEFPNAEDLVKNQSKSESSIYDIEKNDIKYTGIETLDNEEVYVFKGKVNTDVKQERALPVNIVSVKVWISTKDGLQRKVEYYSENNEVVLYQTMKDVKTNIEIPDSEFQFQVPEGVSILDATPRAREMLKQKMAKDGR